MEQITATIKTWECPMCRYRTDINMYDLNREQYRDVPLGCCPTCFGRNKAGVRVETQLVESTDTPTLHVMTVASDDELEATTEFDTDNQGNPIMIQVGERYELRINQATGEMYTELVPIFERKTRPVSDEKLAELKQQRDQSLDALSSIAVKEA